MKAPNLQPPAPSQPAARTKKVTPITDPAVGPLENYSKTPDEYAHLIKGKKLSGALQRDILYCIQKKTWGQKIKVEWASLSFREISKECEDGCPGNVARAINDLVDRGIIAVKDREGCSSKRLYQLTPHRWADAKPYQFKKLQQAAAESEETESDQDERSETKPFGDKMLVRPGKKAASVPARLTPADRDPVDFRIEYLNSGAEPVEVSASTKADTLVIRFKATQQKSEDKAKRVLSGYNTLHNKASEYKRLSDFTTVISDLLLSECGKALNPADRNDQKFIGDIVTDAGPDLPAADYKTFCLDEIADMRKKRKPIKSGILKYLAPRAAFSFEAFRKAAALAEPEQPERAFRSEEDYREWLENIRAIDPEGYEHIIRGGPDA